jgi:hypothetical protein
VTLALTGHSSNADRREEYSLNKRITGKILLSLIVVIVAGYFAHLKYLEYRLQAQQTTCMRDLPRDVWLDLAASVCDGATLSKTGATTAQQAKILRTYRQIDDLHHPFANWHFH